MFSFSEKRNDQEPYKLGTAVSHVATQGADDVWARDSRRKNLWALRTANSWRDIMCGARTASGS